MSVLRDLAIDLINVAKSVKDAKYKLFQLEQLREILLHRDKRLLMEFLGDCISFMTDKSLQIRKFLVKFAKEVFDIDGVNSIAHILSLYTFILAECNDAMLISIARELSRSYGKIIIIIAQMGSGPNANVQESKQLWASFKSLITRMNEYITSSRSETVKIHCLRLIEEEILFGFPVTSTVSDPRLARKVQDPRLARTTQKDTAAGPATGPGGAGGSNATGTGSSGSNPTIEDIPLHHSFISRNELQREAEELFSKFLLWATKGGPQGYPFTATLMSALGQNIASVGTMRANHCANAATAITLLIQGKGSSGSATSIVYTMTKLERDNLARATHRLLRATGVYVSDPEGQITKLRTAVNHLEGIVDSEENAANDVEATKKRDLQTLVEEESRQLENSALVSEGINAEEVMNAIAQAEQQKLRQLQSLEAMGMGAGSGMGSSGSGGVGTGDGSAAGQGVGTGLGGEGTGKLGGNKSLLDNTPKYLHTVVLSTVTELCSDTISLESLTLTSSMKLVEEQHTAGNISQIVCAPLTPQENEYKDYGDLSIRTLLVLLDNYFSEHLPTIANGGLDSASSSSLMNGAMRKKAKTAKSLQELTLRTVLMLILSSLDSDKPKYFVPIVITWSTELMGKIKQEIPTSVTLPREVWIFVSYALQNTLSSTLGDNFAISQLTPSQQQHALQQQIQSRLEMVLALVQKLFLHAQKQHEEEQGEVLPSSEEEAADNKPPQDDLPISNASFQLYESMILAIISRLLQTSLFRQHIQSFVMQLPRIPFSLLALLKAVILTGGTNTTGNTHHGHHGHGHHSSSSGGGSGAGGKHVHEIRKDCLALFGQLVFHSDTAIQETCLSFLLWHCLSDDFEIRSRFITLVINDVLHREVQIDTMIFSFVVQSMITAIGLPCLSPWLQATRAQYLTFSEESQAEDTAMEVDTPSSSSFKPSQDKHLLRETVYWSLHTGMVDYETAPGEYLGDSFDQYFVSTKTMEDEIEESERQKGRQQDCQKAMHFLSQLCVLEYHYLLIYVDLYIAYQYSLTVAGSAVTGATTATGGWSVSDQIFQELKGILPAISHSTSNTTLFQLLSHHPYETLPLPTVPSSSSSSSPPSTSLTVTYTHLTVFLTQILHFFYSDFSVLVKPDMLTLVLQFITRNAQLRGVTMTQSTTTSTLPPLAEEPTKEQKEEEQEDSNAVVTLESIPSWTDALYFQLILPIMNGLSTPQIEACFPKILKYFEPDLEAIKAWIQRMIKPRPPPISKAMILVLLHRFDVEAYDIKVKYILDTIAICLNNKSDFTIEVIKDALGTLLHDPIPPFAIMRTAILTAQSSQDMKKYIFTDMIPKLIEKQVWSVAPKVWEGVIYAMKNYANANMIKPLEVTVTSLSNEVPGKELKSVLKVAPVMKPILAKHVQSLTQTEREGLCSGKSSTAMEEEAAPVVEKDVEKEKIIKELMAVNLTASTA